MSRPTTLRGTKLLLKLGNGATPEMFTSPCALNAKSFGRTATTNDFNVGDCDNPDDPTWVERVKSALSSTITGSGTLAQEFLDRWEDLYEGADSAHVQVILDYAVGPRTYQGSYHLTTLNITGNDGELCQVEIELQSDGEVAKL